MRSLQGLLIALLAVPVAAQSTDTANSLDGTSAGASQASSDQSSFGSGSESSSLVVAGSALLLSVGGGISTTVFVGQSRDRARERRTAQEQLELEPQSLGTRPPSPGVPHQAVPVEQPLPFPGQPPPPTTAPDSPGAVPPPPPPPPPPSTSALEREPTLDAMLLARAWLQANELQLKQDLALGAGPAIEDLASIAGVPPLHRPHFGQVLRQHRAIFRAPHRTPQEAARVMSHVGELVMADPLLRAHGEALLASW